MRKHIAIFCAVACALAVSTSWAQEGAASKQQTLAKNCGQSALTQEKFLDMVHAIAMHGDLTDVAFIERTLGLKFTPSEVNENLKKNNPDERHYVSNSLMGSEMNIVLKVGYNSNEQGWWVFKPKERKWGNLRFAVLLGSDFFDCKPLTTDQLNSRFQGKFSSYKPLLLSPLMSPTSKVQSSPTRDVGGGIGSQILEIPGKDETLIAVDSMYGTLNDDISIMMIYQKPKQGDHK